MTRIEKMLASAKQSPNNVRFSDLCKICQFYFGEPRQQGSSHRVYKTPWKGDPRINIQNSNGRAKPYQVRQVLEAIELFEAEHEHQH